MDFVATGGIVFNKHMYFCLYYLCIVVVNIIEMFQSFEKAMRFSYEEFHIWHQFANALICAGKVCINSILVYCI